MTPLRPRTGSAKIAASRHQGNFAIRTLDRRHLCLGLGAAVLAAGPARAASWADGDNALRIVVVKSRRTLMLMRAKLAFRTFPIALGANPKGPKTAEGDARTPEGDYRIDGFNPQSLYHRALHISYPNAQDLQAGKGGGSGAGRQYRNPRHAGGL